MARRRVFRTRAICPGVTTNLGKKHLGTAIGIEQLRLQMVGRNVTFDKVSSSEINILLDGTVVGQLREEIGNQVALAIDRGQSLTATIEAASPAFDENLNPTGAHFDIKVEYSLEKGQPAIEAPRSWRAIPSPHAGEPYTRSFFTKVAGITFEGRQRIAARCSVGEELILERDPDNQFDEGAIRVIRLNGQQLGFIPADVSRGGNSSGLAYQMDHGSKYRCTIKNITGGGYERSIGVNLEITEITENEDHDALVQRRINELTNNNDEAVVIPKPAVRWKIRLLVAAVLSLLVLLIFIESR